MPPTGPIHKASVCNRREKITIDGVTATRGYFQLFNAKRLAADDAVAAKTARSDGHDSQRIQTTHDHVGYAPSAMTYYDYKRLAAGYAPSVLNYYDYKRRAMMQLENTQEWAAAAAKVLGRIKGEEDEIEMAEDDKRKMAEDYEREEMAVDDKREMAEEHNRTDAFGMTRAAGGVEGSNLWTIELPFR